MLSVGVVLAALVLTTGFLAADEVVLRDGTVIEVASFKVTGSYVMLTLPDGRQMAYDVADVEPASLAPAASAEGEVEAASSSLGQLAGGLELGERATQSAIRITDADVEHVRGAGGTGEESPEEDGGATPEGYTEGGGVSLNNVEIVALEEGQWRVSGEVINRSPQVARSVRMKLEVGGPTPSTIDFDVTGTLPPDERAVFEHVFRAEVEPGQGQPPARFRVIWMQEETTRRPSEPPAGPAGPPVPQLVPPQERPIQ